jgi:arsenate reductase (thioredoxin)
VLRPDLLPVTLLFACTHNAGRSQMAAAFCRHHGRGRVDVESAGTAPADAVHPVVVEAMRERGVDLTGVVPRLLTPEIAADVDVLVTMGCGETCPVLPRVRVIDWPIADPSGLPLERVRAIRDDIERRVVALVAELTPAAADVVR